MGKWLSFGRRGRSEDVDINLTAASEKRGAETDHVAIVRIGTELGRKWVYHQSLTEVATSISTIRTINRLL